MADKRRYTVSLPDHVADAVEKHARPLGSTPTEYAGDIVRWWYGQGCPPVTPDENELRKRLQPVPQNLNIWKLNKADMYQLVGDEIVQKLLTQLGIPNLFATASEHDSVSMTVAFDNHPSHWLLFTLFKGSTRPDGDGLSFSAYPKASISKKVMETRLQVIAKQLEASGPIQFSQIPAAVEKRVATAK